MPHEPTRPDPLLWEVVPKVLPTLDHLDSCLVNLYEGPYKGVGWHADDEDLFQGLSQPISIASLSIGASRLFQWRLTKDHARTGQVLLNSGDLLLMQGLTQAFCQHRVPKTCDPWRVNLTWRRILQHHPSCPLAGTPPRRARQRRWQATHSADTQEAG